MWWCEGKLKVKIAHFRLPSTSQKRACLSSLVKHIRIRYTFTSLPENRKHENRKMWKLKDVKILAAEILYRYALNSLDIVEDASIVGL